MAIPEFDELGWFPGGIYDCTLREAAGRFGRFHLSDRRPVLWARLVEFLNEARASGLVEAVVLDGSFVGARTDPNDIDLAVVVRAGHDFSADLPPSQYNLLAQKRVRKRFGLDIVVVKNGSENLEWAIAFFQQIKQRPGFKKGVLRIRL
jgi:hypothetical protein